MEIWWRKRTGMQIPMTFFEKPKLHLVQKKFIYFLNPGFKKIYKLLLFYSFASSTKRPVNGKLEIISQ